MVLKAEIFSNQLKFTSAIKFLCIYVSSLSKSIVLGMGKVTVEERTTSNDYTPNPSDLQRRLK